MTAGFLSVWHGVGVLALIGVWLMVFGWRGRRVDDHPWCRTCRFDLRGSLPGAAACPECGADLGRARAVVAGRRAKQPMMLGAGVVVLIAGMAIGGMTAYQRLAPIDWNAHKPNWWLMRDLGSSDGERAQAALAILVVRDEDEGLAPSQRAALVDHLFESYVSGLRTSKVEWAPVLERAWLAGELTEERRIDLARSAANLHLEVSRSNSFSRRLAARSGAAPTLPQAKQNGYLEFDIVIRPTIRLQGRLTLVARPLEVRLGEVSYRLRPEGHTMSMRGSGFSSGGAGRSIPTLVEPGEHVLHTVWQIECALDDDAATSVSWQETCDATVEVLEPGPDAVTFISDEATAQRIRDAIQISATGFRSAVTVDEWMDIAGIVHLDLPDMRVALAIDILHGGEWLSKTGVGQGWGAGGPFHLLVPRGREYESLEFVLYPAEASALFGRDPEASNDRPHWFGVPITIRVPVAWYDDFESEGIDELIRERFGRSVSSWEQARRTRDARRR